MNESQADRAPPYSWYALGVLFAVYLVNFVDRQLLSILANDIKADLGLTDAQLGFLYGTAFAIFYALFGIPLGRLADSWSRTRLLALGLTLWSAMTMLSGLARGPALLTAARVGVGIGEATASPCAYSLISDWFPARLRATALAIYSSGLFLGSGLSLLVGGAIVAAWNGAWPYGAPFGLAGWQAAFLIVGFPGLILALLVLSLREPPRGGDRAPPEQARAPWRAFFAQVALILPPFTLIGAARSGVRGVATNVAVAAVIGLAAWGLAIATGSWAQFVFLGLGVYSVMTWATALRRDDAPTFRLTFGTPAFVALVVTYGIVSFTGYTISYWAAPFAERTFALSKAELGWMVGAPAALGGFLGVIAGGWAADRLQRRMPAGRLWVIFVALLAPVPLNLLAYRTDELGIFVVCAFLGQVATSSALGAAAAATQALVVPRMKGTATAIFFLGATLIGLGLGPYVAGLVSERSGNLGTGVIANLAIVPLGVATLGFAINRYARSLASSAERAAR